MDMHWSNWFVAILVLLFMGVEIGIACYQAYLRKRGVQLPLHEYDTLSTAPYNKKVVNTVFLTVMLLITLGGAITFSAHQQPGWAAFFIFVFLCFAEGLYIYHKRAWRNNQSRST